MSTSVAYLKGIPGIPRSALDAVKDENVRTVLASIIDGWDVRNGTAGDKSNRFITASELTKASNNFQSAINALDKAVKDKTVGGAANLNGIASQLLSQIINSQLFTDLQAQVNTIDTALAAETANRISDMAAEAAARIGTDTAQGSLIASLEDVTDDHATQISGLVTRVDDSESLITTLQSTTASQATALTNLTTRVGSAESNIGTLQTTTADQATSISAISTRVSTAEAGLLGAQTNITAAEAAIIAEATTRANEDNAITTSLTTQFATVNGTLSALQTSQTTTANAVAALTETMTTLEASVGSNTVLLAEEALTRANADNQLYAQYTVKLDINGYVAGFGLASESSAAGGTTSSFIIRADKFAVVMPGYDDFIPFAVGDFGVDFNGNLTGSIDGVSASTVRLNTEEALNLATTSQAQSAAASLLLADLASDSKLTPVEKQQVKLEWDGIVNSYSQIDSQAFAFGASGRTAHTVAYNDLNTYLSPLLSSLTTTSDISGATFRAKFSTYYQKRQDLVSQLSGIAASTAAWSLITGAGKPEDYATAGARIGTNLLKGDGSTAFASDFIATWNKMTAANASTFMANAAIGTAQIQNAAITSALIASLAVGTAQIQDLSVGGKKLAPPTQGSLYVNGGNFGGVWHGLGRYVLLSIVKVDVNVASVSNPWGGAKVARPAAVLEGQYSNYFDIRNTSEVDLYTTGFQLAMTVYAPATITYVYL